MSVFKTYLLHRGSCQIGLFCFENLLQVLSYNIIEHKMYQETGVTRRKSVDVTILLLLNCCFYSKRVFNFKTTINVHYFKTLYSLCIWNVGTSMASKRALPMKYLYSVPSFSKLWDY